MSSLRLYLRSRARLGLAAALTGASVALCAPPPPGASVEGLREALAGRTELTVGAFVWEPPRGVLTELLWGRPLLFEAHAEGEPQDVFRAFVQLTPNGTPLGVHSVKNLTQTALAEERGLVVAGARALYATLRDGQVESATFLDLTGDERSPRANTAARLRLGISRFLETGDPRGVGRTDLALEAPSPRLRLEDRDGTLVFASGRGELPLPSDALERARHEPLLLENLGTLRTRAPEPTPFLHWAADVGRLLVGPGPIAWLEGRVFRARDAVHRLTARLTRPGPEPELREPTPAPPRTDAAVPAAPEAHPWPPARLAPLLTNAGEEEGVWRAIRPGVLAADEPPLFYRAVLHPDVERPYAEVHFVAIDTRRLDLGMRAGYEDPHPETGPPGSGHVPSEPEFTSRLVATFNGAFKAVHGSYGMHAEGRLLVRPSPEAATVRVDRDGRVGLGSFPRDPDVTSSLAREKESGLVDFRQNLDPLVEDGVENPRKRRVWGEHLYGESVATERSALCVTRSLHLLYAWSPEATAETLARALAQAECDYAVHLDMNPGHCQFSFHDVQSFQPLAARSENLDLRMKVNPSRYLRWSPKDFFYLARRKVSSIGSSFEWTTPPGTMPELPLGLGAKKVGHVNLEVDRVPLDALEFSLVVGSRESTGAPPESPALASAPLLAWGLGHRTAGSRPGLVLGGSTVVPFHRSEATLVLGGDAPLTLLPPGVPVVVQPNTTFVQLPLAARDGEITPMGRQIGDGRARAALCFDDRGHLLVGRVTHDTVAPLVQALLDEGCRSVALLDRGSHHPAYVARAGTELPLPERLDQTLLLAHPRALAPRAYHWRPEN